MAETWLITGCSAGGIGAGIAKGVLARGENVIVTARNTDKLTLPMPKGRGFLLPATICVVADPYISARS